MTCTLAEPGRPCELSIVIPTLNEAANVVELLRRLDACLHGIRWEAIVVDDESTDGTAARVDAIARRDPRVRCLRRVGRRGLAGACLAGMAVARGRCLAVIDADLQHDERLLPRMLATLQDGDVDLVVGSRYSDGGATRGWHPARRAISRLATRLGRGVLGVALDDPMSGFFMVRPRVVQAVSARLSGDGFKLLLDLVASSPRPLRVIELPYRFASRRHGHSKLDAGVAWAFARLVVRLGLARVGGRFGRFCAVGSAGVVVHVGVLAALQRGAHAGFAVAQTAAVLASIVCNFALNNRLTFGERRLAGTAFAAGLTRFAVLCAGGAMVNVAIADAALRLGVARFAAVAAGIAAGAVCNWLTTSAFVWRTPAVAASPAR